MKIMFLKSFFDTKRSCGRAIDHGVGWTLNYFFIMHFQAHSMFGVEKPLIATLDKMFSNALHTNESHNEYIQDLEMTSPDAEYLLSVTDMPSKSNVLVITGESGSGKTVYATGMLRDNIRHSYQSLYHRVDSEKVLLNPDEKQAIQEAIYRLSLYLWDKNEPRGVNDLLMAISNKLQPYETRNELWHEKMSTSEVTTRWRNCAQTPPSLTLDGLVVI
jgi:hypothetical protein